jgi:hypothetical protein
VARGVGGASVDEQAASTVLEKQLATSPARREWHCVTRDDADRGEPPSTGPDEIANQRALRTEGETITCVLHVGTLDDSPVGRVACRTDSHVRVGAVRQASGANRPFT